MDMPPPDPISGNKKPHSQDAKKTTMIVLTGTQINLKDFSTLPFSRYELNNAIKELS
jgi:hypothetical protein